MTTEPIEPHRAFRHRYSAGGLGLRVLLLAVMLMSLAVAVTGGQTFDASSIGGRQTAGDSAVFADGEPMGGPGTSGQQGGRASDGAPAGSDGPPGGIAPAASASPGAPGGGSAGGPPDDWYLYHQWTDPSWPDAGQVDPDGRRPPAGAPLPTRTAGGYNWDPPVTPTIDPLPPTGWTPTPSDPTDPALGTPTGSPATTGPAPDPAGSDDQPETPTPTGSSNRPGQSQPDGVDGPLPPQRDPVAAGPDDDLGLGDTVDEPAPTPTPEPTASPVAPPRRALEADTTPAGEYHQTLIYSGLIGLALAAIGLTMVGLRRRRW